eukprot:12561844-Alexandrium_andersonii.AAC.1
MAFSQQVGAAMGGPQTLQSDLTGIDEQERFEHLARCLEPEAPGQMARQSDSDLQADANSPEAWRALVEARWRLD